LRKTAPIQHAPASATVWIDVILPLFNASRSSPIIKRAPFFLYTPIPAVGQYYVVGVPAQSKRLTFLTFGP
jgi:hypothetical protein